MKKSNQQKKQSKASKSGSKPGGKVANLAVSKTMKSRNPRIRSEGECVVIAHSELFDWPLGKLAFTANLTAAVGPGLSTCFPWLSGVANNFETYRFRRLKFVYYPRCAATQAGQIVMLLDPKSSDTNPRTLQIASTYHVRANGNMWAPLELEVPQEILSTGGPRRFIRSSTLQADAAALYDVGRFFFITDGANPFDAIIGEIGVEYEVELWTPGQRPAGQIFALWVNGVGTAASASNPFGNTPTFGGLILDEVVGNVIAVKNMELSGVNQLVEYGMWLVISGTGVSAITPSYSAATQVYSNVVIGAGSTIAMCYWTFRPSAAVGTITFAITATTVTECNCTISALPYDIDF
jgi:hypothetical protein